jgi:hypothetical protein
MLAVQNFESWMPWSTNPLYAILHESIYSQGVRSGWAAHRVREGFYKDSFDAVQRARDGLPVLFTGMLLKSERRSGPI